MTLAIQRFLSEHPRPDAAAVDAFVAAYPPPIVEGTSITFVFRGKADDVRLRHFIYGLPSLQRFVRVPGGDLWYLTMDVPHGSRVEYKLELRRGEDRGLFLDPLNDKLARDPYGANSVCHGSGYDAPDWAHEDPEARRGTLENVMLHSDALGRDEEVTMYLPARLRTSRRYPLLVVFDGADYVRYAGLRTVLDNLIHRYEISQVIVALTNSADRFADYTANADHARFVTTELLPCLEERYPVRGRPRFRGVMGASLGAVAALSTAWRHPGVFGRALLQSGSFRFTDIGEHDGHPALEPVVQFVNAFRDAPGRPTEKLFVSCGTYESLIYENRSLVPVLQRAPLELRYTEARDGHNWENWRDRLREGLSWLFPGPLALVYE